MTIAGQIGGAGSTMVRAADLLRSCGYRVRRSNPPVFIYVEKIGQNFSLRNASGHLAVMGTWCAKLIGAVMWQH